MGNQTFFGRLAVTFLGTQLAPLNVDAWDGFQAERRALSSAGSDSGRPADRAASAAVPASGRRDAV
jgi:hypothetical protein